MVLKKFEGKALEQFINETNQKKNIPKRVKRFNKPLQVYLTQEERERIISYAREKGLSASAFIRLLLKEKGII